MACPTFLVSAFTALSEQQQSVILNLAVVALALAIGAVAWLRTFDRRTAISWLAGGGVVAMSVIVYGLSPAPSAVVRNIISSAAAVSCYDALARFTSGEDGHARGTWFDVASGELELMSCRP